LGLLASRGELVANSHLSNMIVSKGKSG